MDDYESLAAVEIGKRLRKLRKMADMNIRDLAIEAAVSKSAIILWENATRGKVLKPRNMQKILDAIKKRGVDCDEKWILTGQGNPPRIHQSSSVQKIIEQIDANRIYSEDELSTKLITELNFEMNSFISVSSQTVVVKIDNNYMLPVLEKGDFVGGIWQSGNILTGEKICIIKYNDKLDIRKVRPSKKLGYYEITYLKNESENIKNFEIKECHLSGIAPIIRIWR